ncbi:MAG: hypothetical protein Q8S02_04635 [Hydrogenophaga sp.]|nr:hypothetical protein [Hydrogenophaga sp.]
MRALDNGGPGTPGACNVHNPGCDFNDDIIAHGAAFWCGLVLAYLGRSDDTAP